MLDGRTGEDGAVVNLAIACNLHAVAEHAVVTHHRVVADMDTFHEEVAIADLRHAALIGTAVDDHVLADDIVVADLHIRFGTSEVEILRQGSNN